MSETILNDIPRGYKRIIGATTAPPGSVWYYNGESIFSGKRKSILVKEARK